MTAPATSTAHKALQVVGGFVFLPLMVWGWFHLAGGWGWIPGWTYIGLMIVVQGASGALLYRQDPEMITRRGKFGEGTPAWDRAVLGAFAVSYGAILVVAAMDATRWDGPAWHPALFALGGALYLASVALLHAAMSVNTFFEKSARLQTDRDQRVIDTGPYARVRHPGYSASLLGFVLAPPLLLGSWFAFLPAVPAAFAFILRTWLEDRMLRNGLPGYAEYAQRVPHRLVPGVW